MVRPCSILAGKCLMSDSYFKHCKTFINPNVTGSRYNPNGYIRVVSLLFPLIYPHKVIHTLKYTTILVFQIVLVLHNYCRPWLWTFQKLYAYKTALFQCALVNVNILKMIVGFNLLLHS